ncbi:MAG TPA: DUF2950 domain-containing protein [Terriglobales bacterium]|nr:DUF2950 domain-containing protein [Terriglobales bacterium]
MSSRRLNVAHSLLLAILVLALSGALGFCSQPQPKSSEEASSPQPGQKTFATPQQAAEALIHAAEQFDVPALNEMFGPNGKGLVTTADAVQDKNRAALFVAKAHAKTSVVMDPKSRKRAILSVGDDDWPFPVPIVKQGGRWYFDSKAGQREILARRIGANELDAIAICRGFVDAQEEYASQVHDDSGITQYAQRIISTSGKRDGLVWRNPDGSLGGPISEKIADAIEQGYTKRGEPYHGYYFKVLKGQGPAAPMGQLDFVIEGVMIGGFALVAAPAEYRVTGVKTFIVSHNGIVYQKDLGPDTLQAFKDMERYNPDKTWHRTDDQWPPEVAAAGE